MLNVDRAKLEAVLLGEFHRPEHAPMSDHGVDEAGGPQCVRCPVPAFEVLTPEEIASNQAAAVEVFLNQLQQEAGPESASGR